MDPIVVYPHAKNFGRSLEPFRSKVQRSKKNTFFGHLIPYNPGLKNFSETQSYTNNGPYHPLHSCKNLGRSLELFWSKVQRSKKNTFFGYLIPYNPELRIFLGNNLTQTISHIVIYIHATKWEDP